MKNESMGELIRIGDRELKAGEKVQTVDARELHAFLEVETSFKDWIARRVKDYAFQDGTDFCSFLSESSGGRRAREYALTLPMAKELAMVERTARGRQARLYFIECEKRYREMLERAASSDVHAVFDRMLRFEARKDSPRLWEEELIASLCKTYGIRRVGTELPAPLLGVIGWLYRVVLGDDLYAEMKARNPGGDKRALHYQLWQETLRRMVDDDVSVIAAFSGTASSKEDFKARMLAHYRNRPFQLALGGGRAA